MIIEWDNDDKLFVVTVPELPVVGHMVVHMKRQSSRDKKLSKVGL
jgi:hypothetical protein